MFSPQTRMNRFVFLNLSVLSLEMHLGVTASPHTPFPTGYVTLPVHSRSPPLRLMLSHSREPPFAKNILSDTKVFQSCLCPFDCFPQSSESRHTVGNVGCPNGVWCAHLKLPVKRIRRQDRWAAVHNSWFFIAVYRFDIMGLHDAIDSVLTARFTNLFQVH